MRLQHTTFRQFLGVLAFVISSAVIAAPPELYRQAAYESPVQGGPDDLLLLSGFGLAAGDTVVYRAVTDTAKPTVAPTEVPEHSDAEFGIAPVSAVALPYSLTIRLPKDIRADEAYALWVYTPRGEWSKPVMINDARPLWASPAYVYASGMPASLPRELKIVGRNLEPIAGHSTLIRLVGPQSFSAPALSAASAADSVDHYVARVRLPARLMPGRYRIAVNRDGASWVDLAGQSLDVLADAPANAEFSISDAQFGGCRPDDGSDATACILRAIAAAKRAGGGVVYFGPGTWDLVDSAQPGLSGDAGIVVPAGVGLRGAGSKLTQVQRHAQWTEHAPMGAAFTLLGNTQVSGFTFRDLKVYQPQDRAGPFLQLGEPPRIDPVSKRLVGAAVDAVVITGNTFDKTMVAVGGSGVSISQLFITYNIFGAFNSALELAGSRYDVFEQYRVDDSVVDHNVFKPGSKLDLLDKTGALASELGAGHRVDFSDNTADGAATDYLYSSDDARGWRAAFFWNLHGNGEELLISQNSITCSGDKIGDGEALAFDNNGNTFAFTAMAGVLRASPATVAVSAPLVARQDDRDVPVGSYYVGHWIQIADGPGLGQVRKIISYSTDVASHITAFKVAPDWDVTPVPGRSRVAVGREFWQAYAVGNRIDNRQPLCQKSNRSRKAAGVITMWAQSADSVIAGNRQFDSDGIHVQQNYIVSEHPCPDCTMQGFFQSSLDIRDNVVDGEYDWDTDCSESGIELGLAAAPWGSTPPPTVSYGVSVSHNVIRHADGLQGGGISQLDSWWPGPEPGRWPLSDSAIIQHNSITDIAEPRSLPICTKSRPRVGIAFPDHGIAWRTVLYANSCKNVSLPVGSGGVNTVKVCPASGPQSCECP